MVIGAGRGEGPGRAQRVAATSRSIMRGAACARQHQEGIGPWGPEIEQTVWHQRLGGETIVPPSGLERSCPAEAGKPPFILAHPGGPGAPPYPLARRVTFRELLGIVTCLSCSRVHCDFLLETVTESVALDLKIVVRLQVRPEGFRHPEEAGEA